MARKTITSRCFELAFSTRIGLFARMRLHMNSEFTECIPPVFAVSAGKPLFSWTMCSQMDSEAPFYRCFVIALILTEFLFLDGVGPYMTLHTASCCCFEITYATLKRFLTLVFYFDMPSEMGALLGWVVTLIALERFLICVRSNVHRQVTSLTAFKITQCTGIGFFSGVGPHVSPKISFFHYSDVT